MSSKPVGGAVANDKSTVTSPASQTSSEGLVDVENQNPTKPAFFSRANFFGAIDTKHGDLPLLACSFVTGMVDAASFRNYGMFIGMQTGNTVILGVSTAGLPSNPHAWLTTLVSLATFLVGAFFTFRASAFITPSGPGSNRTWATTLFTLQGLIILLSAALATVPGLIPQNPGGQGVNDHDPEGVLRDIRIVSLIPPLAFQGGMQIATSRLLGFNELPVNVLTSTYADIMGDMRMLAHNNVKRNRRVVSVVLLLVGAIISGWMLRSRGGLMSVLWVAGFIKVMTGFAYFVFTPAAKPKAPKA